MSHYCTEYPKLQWGQTNRKQQYSLARQRDLTLYVSVENKCHSANNKVRIFLTSLKIKNTRIAKEAVLSCAKCIYLAKIFSTSLIYLS